MFAPSLISSRVSGLSLVSSFSSFALDEGVMLMIRCSSQSFRSRSIGSHQVSTTPLSPPRTRPERTHTSSTKQHKPTSHQEKLYSHQASHHRHSQNKKGNVLTSNVSIKFLLQLPRPSSSCCPFLSLDVFWGGIGSYDGGRVIDTFGRWLWLVLA